MLNKKLPGLSRLAVGVVIALFAVAGQVQASTVSGVSVAELISEGPRAGKYMYTLQLSWNAESPISAFALDLDLEACPCVCSGVFDLDHPSGLAQGNGGACTALMNGKFACDGDPFSNLDVPVIDWWPMSSGCRPHGVGTGTFTFYSELRPRSVTALPTDNLIVRSGALLYSGKVLGQLPSCIGCGTVSIDEGSWGRIKSVYR